MTDEPDERELVLEQEPTQLELFTESLKAVGLKVQGFSSAITEALARVSAAEGELQGILRRLDELGAKLQTNELTLTNMDGMVRKLEMTARSYWPSFTTENCLKCGSIVHAPHPCPKCGKATA